MKYIRKVSWIVLITAVLSMSSMSFSYAKVRVIIGQATIGEHGKRVRTKPGDQSGSEVSTMSFHYNRKSWAGWCFVARARDAEAAKKIAIAIRQACKNNNIGYGAGGPDLYSAAREVNFNLSKVKRKVNCVCSSLATVCAASAGLYINPWALTTNDTFVVYTAKSYRTKPDKLQEGDILVTDTRFGHHVAIVHTSSNKTTGADPNPSSPYKKGASYRTLKDLYVHVGPGSRYYCSTYESLPAQGRSIAIRETDFEEDVLDPDAYAIIPKDTVFRCLEGRRNWLKTDAGWVCGVMDDVACVELSS